MGQLCTNHHITNVVFVFSLNSKICHIFATRQDRNTIEGSKCMVERTRNPIE